MTVLQLLMTLSIGQVGFCVENKLKCRVFERLDLENRFKQQDD